MDLSTFDSRPLSLAYITQSTRDKNTIEIPNYFVKNTQFRTFDFDTFNLNKIQTETTIHGLILGFDPDDSNTFSLQHVRLQFDFPIQSKTMFENTNDQRRFVNLMYAYDRWQQFDSNVSELSDLLQFHAREKLTLLAHDPEIKEKLGHMLANPPDITFDKLLEQYYSSYRNAMRTVPTRGRHFNVLEHLYGYVVKNSPDEINQNLLELIRDFNTGDVPLVTPLKELKNYFSDQSIEWISRQSYLDPKREQLRLLREIKHTSDAK